MKEDKKIVCLGGGIGTVNLLRGLKQYTQNISIIISVADEGGSGGRVRRLYQMHPPGDVISCLAAMAKNEEQARLLTYRLPGDRYAKDNILDGHKVGNIMLAAATQMTGSFDNGIALLKDIFDVEANLYAATKDMVSLSARTIEGQIVEGEETIDLGKYEGKRVLEHVFLHPENPAVDEKVIQTILDADVIIAGPGDLYTTSLPVLIIPAIKQALLAAKAEKYFVLNVANKPFETKGYFIEDFVNAITKHVGTFPFAKVVANNNFSLPIPAKYHYTYVTHRNAEEQREYTCIEGNLVDETFPLYHDSQKLAKLIWETI